MTLDDIRPESPEMNRAEREADEAVRLRASGGALWTTREPRAVAIEPDQLWVTKVEGLAIEVRRESGRIEWHVVGDLDGLHVFVSPSYGPKWTVEEAMNAAIAAAHRMAEIGIKPRTPRI